jgi:hypothetical protein
MTMSTGAGEEEEEDEGVGGEWKTDTMKVVPETGGKQSRV